MLRTLAALLALAAAIPAQNVLDTFTGGVNLGGWTFGANSTVQGSGGNSGGWVHTTNLDTFAPQLRTTGTNAFTKNWRAFGIRSVGVDLITVSTQFAFQRECTLILSNGVSSMYYLGTEFVPQPGTGWKSFEFTFDPDSTTMPPGWLVLSGGAPDTVWNTVIQDVRSVTFFYGDPTFFFIFDIWNVGADNVRISTAPVWIDVGNGLPGAGGTPKLAGHGQLVEAALMKLDLTGAAPSAATGLVIGFSEIDAPFKGGVLVPSVDVLVNLATSPAGALSLPAKWPAGVPSGTQLWFQAWVQDAGGPKGFAASNGLRASVP